jgi:UDP-N-acetylmuramoyl-tripeptide--D-alanyl-D-alanine ligase
LNNHIGVPLTVLNVKKNTAFAVIEMGANHLHEMSNGIAEIIWYGTNTGFVCGQVKQSEPYLQIDITKGSDFNSVETQLVGNYNLPNVLCAIAVGKYFNVDDEKIKSAIESYVPSNSRSQMMVHGTNHFILDAYNANPSSMQLAIENFAKLKADKKILVLGAMMELGIESLHEHEQLIRLIEQYKWNDVILVGGDFEKINHRFHFFANSIDVGKWLHSKDFKDCYFLIKGSRSMEMEKALPS